MKALPRTVLMRLENWVARSCLVEILPFLVLSRFRGQPS